MVPMKVAVQGTNELVERAGHAYDAKHEAMLPEPMVNGPLHTLPSHGPRMASPAAAVKTFPLIPPRKSVKMRMKDIISAGRRRFGLLFLIVLAGVCASILMYWITDQGPGVTPDSTTYVEAAQSLLVGNGLVVQGGAMTHYPPAYPLLLGAVGLLLKGDILLASRLLAALLFGANLVLFCLAVQACTRHSIVATGCAMLVFLSSAPAILIHSRAMSEAPFITFSTAAFLLLAYHIVRPTPYLLVLASLMAGFAAATRYVGVVLFPTMALALLLLGNQPIKHKLRDVIVFAGIAALPLASWLIRNVMIAQTAANREITFHPFSLIHAKQLIIMTYDFFMTVSISNWIKVFHLVVAAVLFVLGLVFLYRTLYIKQNVASIGIVLPALCIFYSLIYVTFLMITISFVDAHIPIDHRIIFPIFFTLFISGSSLAWSMSEAFCQPYIWYSFVFFILFSVSINANRAIPRALDIHKNGSGYTSLTWKHSETIFYLSKVHDVRKIYSNGPDVIHFLTGKESILIPQKISPLTRRLNEKYEEQVSQMIRECREGRALFVYLNKVTWRWYLPSIDEVESIGNLPVLRRMQDGVIYGTR
jgi:hypothetical protein